MNQQPPMHQLRMSPLRPFSGWTKIPSSLPAYIYFFHLFSTPKFSPLLPTTYQPLPPSLHRQSSRDVEWERAWSRSLEQRAWSRGAAGAGAGPTRDPGKHLTFFSLVYFVCLFVELHCTRYTALQHSSTSSVCFYGAALHRSIAKKATLRCSACFARKKKEEEGDGSIATIAFFFFLMWSCATA